MLYLSVDLGNDPSLEAYQRNVAALLTLSRYSTFLVSLNVVDPEQPPPQPLPEAGVTIVRTSLASPWVTVLADLAKSSAPIGYGLAVLYALHRLLQTIMSWQRHRRDMKYRDWELDQLRAAGITIGGPEELRTKLGLAVARIRESEPPTSQGVLSDDPDVIARVIARSHRAIGVPPEPPDPHWEKVNQAAQDLGEIQAAEMIPRDDPRATGNVDDRV